MQGLCWARPNTEEGWLSSQALEFLAYAASCLEAAPSLVGPPDHFGNTAALLPLFKKNKSILRFVL